MEVQYLNTIELKDFVKTHSLQNMHSIIQFSAYVYIETAENNLKERMKVSVTFDGYENQGRVTLIENQLDPNKFPTVFDAKWQTFEHAEKTFLKVTGIHSKNPIIGKYLVKIVPIEKLKD